jgi:hypothetical protein
MQVVASTRAAMDTVLLRLTAVEAMLMQKPIISGRYTSIIYSQISSKLEVRRPRTSCPRVCHGNGVDVQP